jgi:inosose dehydratase
VFAEVSGCVHGDRNTALSKRPVIKSDAEWKTFGERMTEVGRYLKTQGMTIAYHHHMGTVVETEAEIDRLMAVTGPEVGLLLDTGHLTYSGGDPVAVAKRHTKRIVHIHCKDVRPDVLKTAKGGDWPFLKAVLAGVFTVPGDGSINYEPVLTPFAKSGYQGWLVVEAEQDPKKAHPLTYARKGHDYLRPLAKKIGL